MIIFIYSVCPIFTNPPDWRKALSNGVKTHLFELKTTKISTGAVLSRGEKKDSSERGGGNDWNAQYIPLLQRLKLILWLMLGCFLIRKWERASERDRYIDKDRYICIYRERKDSATISTAWTIQTVDKKQPYSVQLYKRVFNISSDNGWFCSFEL